MGSVGISFGSPTSGQGFDVATTVSQLVTNLQAVETPWNTQLTSLQSQDTALTNIGTDLSTLSTALESLTDFQGVLSEKQGSSSDTSVVQLTGASNSAVAGSHSIVVTRLAQTASWYSDAVGANDTLSGSLTIGSNPAIQISSTNNNNTLSSLVAYINSGNYGVTAQVTTDSTGERLDLVSTTSGQSGNFTVTSGLTDTSNAGTSGSGTAIGFTQPTSGVGQDAGFSVDGIPMTNPSNTVSTAIPGVTFQLLSTAPSETVQVEITNDNSDVETAVNSFVTAYNTVIGDVNTQEGDDSSGNPEPLYGSPVLATLQMQLESAFNFQQPAQVVASASSVDTSDALSGSLSIQVGTGTAVSVNVPSGTNTLQGLADAINATAGIGVTAGVTINGTAATLALTGNTAGSTGAITVDSSNLTDTTSGSQVSFGQSQTNAITSLTQLGIEASNSDDGTITLNTSTLDSALNNNYQDVVNFLQPSGNFTSFGGNFTNTLDSLANTGPDGDLYLALQANASTETQLNTNVTNQEALITTEKATLTNELNEANYTLQEIPTLLQQVNEMYSAISGYNENTSG